MLNFIKKHTLKGTLQTIVLLTTRLTVHNAGWEKLFEMECEMWNVKFEIIIILILNIVIILLIYLKDVEQKLEKKIIVQ